MKKRLTCSFQCALHDGSELVVLLESKTFLVVVRTPDGRNHRYGDLRRSGKFAKLFPECPQPEGIKRAVAELKKWAMAKSVMES
jgi:hypothetical protein